MTRIVKPATRHQRTILIKHNIFHNIIIEFLFASKYNLCACPKVRDVQVARLMATRCHLGFNVGSQFGAVSCIVGCCYSWNPCLVVVRGVRKFIFVVGEGNCATRQQGKAVSW